MKLIYKCLIWIITFIIFIICIKFAFAETIKTSLTIIPQVKCNNCTWEIVNNTINVWW